MRRTINKKKQWHS